MQLFFGPESFEMSDRSGTRAAYSHFQRTNSRSNSNKHETTHQSSGKLHIDVCHCTADYVEAHPSHLRLTNVLPDRSRFPHNAGLDALRQLVYWTNNVIYFSMHRLSRLQNVPYDVSLALRCESGVQITRCTSVGMSRLHW